MARRARVMGFSLPPETYDQIERVIKREHKTRSELLREMVRMFLGTIESVRPINDEALSLSDEDINKVLKLYYRLMSERDSGSIVVGLGILDDGKGRVLIGKRKTKDEIKKDLTWVFPGGRMNSLDFGAEIGREVKAETGLNVKVGELIHARVHPDAQYQPVKVITLYYHCRLIDGGSRLKPGGDLAELKWVTATSIFHYFTTSTADEVVRFLNSL